MSGSEKGYRDLRLALLPESGDDRLIADPVALVIEVHTVAPPAHFVLGLCGLEGTCEVDDPRIRILLGLVLRMRLACFVFGTNLYPCRPNHRLTQ